MEEFMKKIFKLTALFFVSAAIFVSCGDETSEKRESKQQQAADELESGLPK